MHLRKKAIVSVLFFVAFVFALALSSKSTVRVQAASASKEHGAELFANSGCVHCHGPAGLKAGIGPSLKDVAKRRKPEEIFKQIHDGSNAMPAFGDQLKPEEIEDLVAYLRSKRKAPPEP